MPMTPTTSENVHEILHSLHSRVVNPNPNRSLYVLLTYTSDNNFGALYTFGEASARRRVHNTILRENNWAHVRELRVSPKGVIWENGHIADDSTLGRYTPPSHNRLED